MPITRATASKKIADLEGRRRKFFASLDGEDDLGVVLRAHIYIEHEIRAYIEEVAPSPEHIRFRDYEYDTLVALAFALGLDPQLKPVLSAIGNLRNKFAHTLDMALTRHEANSLYNVLSADLKAEVHQGYAGVLKNPKYADWPKSIKQLPPKRQFGTYVMMVHVWIVSQIVKSYSERLGVRGRTKTPD